MKAPSWLVEEGTTLEELISFEKEVKARGKMGIYQFHGIDGSYFKISATTHQQFLEYLKINQNRLLGNHLLERNGLCDKQRQKVRRKAPASTLHKPQRGSGLFYWQRFSFLRGTRFLINYGIR